MSLSEIDTLIQKTVLENGLVVVSECIPLYKSVSLGVWIKSGSRNESPEDKGIAHFLEHMLFKGTAKRSAAEIAYSLEKLGGSLNAFTGKEETCFHTHTLDSHLEIGIEILADMICNSLFRQNDIKMEKQVVLEEINSVMDTPDEYIFDLFQEKVFPDQPLGYPILGSFKTVKFFSQQKLISFWNSHYKPDNMVIAVAGNVDHKELVDLVKYHFTFSGSAEKTAQMPFKALEKINYSQTEPLNQAHVCIGHTAASYHDINRFDVIALSTYLGGGLSSKLFQVLREELGYVYSVFSFLDFYEDTGIIGFYLGTDKRNKKKAIQSLYNELDNVINHNLALEILTDLREQIKGGFFLALESSYKRMTRLAKNEINYGRFVSSEELILEINKISVDSFRNTAELFLNTENLNIITLTPDKN